MFNVFTADTLSYCSHLVIHYIEAVGILQCTAAGNVAQHAQLQLAGTAYAAVSVVGGSGGVTIKANQIVVSSPGNAGGEVPGAAVALVTPCIRVSHGIGRRLAFTLLLRLQLPMTETVGCVAVVLIVQVIQPTFSSE